MDIDKEPPRTIAAIRELRDSVPKRTRLGGTWRTTNRIDRLKNEQRRLAWRDAADRFYVYRPREVDSTLGRKDVREVVREIGATGCIMYLTDRDRLVLLSLDDLISEEAKRIAVHHGCSIIEHLKRFASCDCNRSRRAVFPGHTSPKCNVCRERLFLSSTRNKP